MSLAMDKTLMALSLDEEDTPFFMSELLGSSLNEHDILDVLEKGVHTFNEWVIVVKRWAKNPPNDYLQYVPIWIQISNIPVNCYTSEALTALRDLVGKTVVVAFDPTKPITQDFIRVQVKFNVANPLRRSKVITLKGGKSAVILFHYERVQKRCFHCQRLNHEKDFYPLVVRQRQEESRLRKEKITESLKKKQSVIPEDDILFGIVDESLVGTDPATGRCKIAKDVLEEMRRYMRDDTGDSRPIKIDRIQQSLREASKDIMTQRSTLRLEAPPMITSDLNKGKGLVFDYCEKSGDSRALSSNSNPEKLLAAFFKAHAAALYQSAPAQRDGNYAPCSSGVVKKRPVVRRKPPKSTRDQQKRGFEHRGTQKRRKGGYGK
ncbi:PREDICTED: uncharacterized protein LOC106324130 [Brassica oleracea var. oleracea]|uniref:uncharacterized protein LOC106324130 n=1 Tax=Brassica oleracea var. oleracea TaxID=109376 RepID=UPI0006A6D891|nr:PREDICTED: uncharacterized protein LOC106324130 [Brassica oleracea var. oleracea]